MKNLLLMATCFGLWNCQQAQQEMQDDTKEVGQIVAAEIQPLQEGEVHEITVRGKVTSDLFVFGKGAYRLADMKQSDLTMTVIPKIGNIHVKGDSVTIRVIRKEVLRINGSSWSVYSEL